METLISFIQLLFYVVICTQIKGNSWTKKENLRIDNGVILRKKVMKQCTLGGSYISFTGFPLSEINFTKRSNPVTLNSYSDNLKIFDFNRFKILLFYVVKKIK